MALTQGIILTSIVVILSGLSLQAIFRNQKRKALLLILGLALVLRIFMAGDLYLHDWDERFHANVAKNIVDHPLSPVLYDDDVLEYEPNNWGEGKVWLSKPVLTFWAIGASISVFGANEIGLRLPSLIFGLLGVWLTFLIGRKLFNDRIGLIAAFLHAIHGMLLRFGGGLTSSDHVDQLFTLLFAWGIYTYVSYCDLRRKRYLILVGSFIGLAFLTKWIMAIFIGLIIAVVHLFVVRNIEDYIRDGLLILAGALCIAAPWVCFVFLQHPIEIKLVFGDFLARTDSVFEGHTGSPFFYLEQLIIQFRGGILIPLAWFMIVTWRKKSSPQLMLATWIFLPLILLSFLATKRGTYLMMSAPAYFLLTGYFLHWFIRSYRLLARRWVTIGACLLLLGLPVQYSLEQVKPFHKRFSSPAWRLEMKRQITWHHRLGNKIVLHRQPHAMDAMFYYDVLAYQRTLQPDEVRAFESAGFKVIGPTNDR